jgi:hypothetical protein
MARILGAVASSHTPTIGFALDTHKQNDPAWAPIFAGYKPVQEWLAHCIPSPAPRCGGRGPHGIQSTATCKPDAVATRSGAFTGSRTVSTGHGAVRTTASATLPRRM